VIQPNNLIVEAKKEMPNCPRFFRGCPGSGSVVPVVDQRPKQESAKEVMKRSQERRGGGKTGRKRGVVCATGKKRRDHQTSKRYCLEKKLSHVKIFTKEILCGGEGGGKKARKKGCRKIW